MGQNIMQVNDYRIKRLEERDIQQLFGITKVCLLEKGIENIKEDILIRQLKNSLVKKLQSFDFGLFKLNTLIGFVFTDVGQYAYEEKGFAMVDQIYILPEFRTEENYVKMLRHMVRTFAVFGIDNIKTTDNWTLCNDCPVFEKTIVNLAKPQTMYRILT